MSDFGSALQAAIAARGWSLRQAAPRLGVSASLLGMITAGRRRPPLDRLWAWKSLLGLDAGAFAAFFELALHSHGCSDLARYVQKLADDADAARRLGGRGGSRLRVAEPPERG